LGEEDFVAYAFFYDVPGDERVYGQVKAEIGNEQPEGLILQLVAKRREGGLRHFNVWESKEDWERFQQASVRPAVATVLSRIGVTEAPPPPRVEEMDLVDFVPHS
jgi:hypothetical protein